MGPGRDRAVPGVAVVALSGVLAGGASLGAGVAEAAPTPPPPPVKCLIGTTTYAQQSVPGRPLAEAFGAAKKCVDAITGDVLDRSDLIAYGLRPARPAAAVTTAPAAPDPPTTTAPSTTAPSTTAPSTTAPSTTAPSTTAPSTTAPSTTAPATGPTTATPAAPGATPPAGQKPDPSTTDPKAPGGPAGGSAGVPHGAGARPPGAPPSGAAPSPALRAAPPAAAVPVADPAVAPVAPVAPVAVPPGAPVALPAIADAPLGDAIPLDSLLLAPVMPAALFEPLGVPGLASLPGETAPLHTLGGDASAVTTSSEVQALGLEGLHRGGGLPAVLGVTILSGLSGFALRHRILARIRAATAGAPDPDDLDDHLDDDLGGRHSA